MRKVITVGTLLGSAVLVIATSTASVACPTRNNGQIAFDRADPRSPGDTFIFTANPDGHHVRRLARVHTSRPVWSHNGARLAFPALAPDGRITTATINADGSDYKPFTLTDPTLNVGCFGGAWSPTDTRLACEAWDDTVPSRNGIYTISSTDGSGLTRITNPHGGDDQPGAYSPDGRRLVFARFDADGNPLGLFVVDIDGTHLHRITPPGTLIQSGNDGDWSPYGDEIVFSRHISADVRGSLWVIRANGSGLRQIRLQGLRCGALLTDPSGFGCHEPRWSPDGTKLVFDANTSSSANIYTANADGTGLTQVTHDGADDDPAWGTHPPVH